ncbi:TIGR03619 family F420-dependent LLM class oxidoreductase [Streptosporangium sp. CA-115845]|uniref:TIGR03619 family F420-dependent LLM class oxidoreductase n=1 Tax=Streptosporangium sp. CA-115845 TaxID=3240071 RepID=UPI003D9483C2
MLRDWAQTVEGLGFDLLMVSDHIAITPDVAEQYPAPFYEPFTTLAWLAGITGRVRLGTTVLIVPYRHPLLVARMAANLNRLSGGRLVLGVGVGWARQEFDALGVPFQRRGALTDDHLRVIRAAWNDDRDYRAGRIPIWVGGNSDAGLRRAVHLGEAWHPLRFTLPWLREALGRLKAIANECHRPVPALAPRIALRLTETPITAPGRLAGEGTIDQILDDLEQLRLLGSETVVLDPFNGDPDETRHPQTAWQALATVAARWNPSTYQTETRETMTGDDEKFLRRAIELAAAARAAGDPPFGSLLVGPDGTVLAEDRNTVLSDADITAHPELKLARWAARELDPAAAAATTMYTSCQPCPMCGGAIERSGLGRVVFALSNEQLASLKPAATGAGARQEGPALFDEARVPVEGYYR